MYSKIILHNGKERSVQNFHPWIFSGAVKKQDDNVKEGDIVEVLTSDNRYLATGHFHKGTIVTRVISWQKSGRLMNTGILWDSLIIKTLMLIV